MRTEAMWYSKEDLDTFKYALKHDIAKCSGILDDARFGFMGLESFLTEGLIKHIVLMRKAHVCAILIEQARQRDSNVKSVEKLARLSAISSRWSRQRSHAIAVRHM
ncbi:hypothetical protein HJC23_006575 [Cyclotella cryptica]|uniref:Uncharacterized protein n=1 Tax=Cyclotella cryptica TaxID=29204 RepID=A0ABD3PLC4_9STRA